MRIRLGDIPLARRLILPIREYWTMRRLERSARTFRDGLITLACEDQNPIATFWAIRLAGLQGHTLVREYIEALEWTSKIALALGIPDERQQTQTAVWN